MSQLRQFASSSNGDTWWYWGGSDGIGSVLHRGNPASGGHETRVSIETFRAQTPRGPQHYALDVFLEDMEREVAAIQHAF